MWLTFFSYTISKDISKQKTKKNKKNKKNYYKKNKKNKKNKKMFSMTLLVCVCNKKSYPSFPSRKKCV